MNKLTNFFSNKKFLIGSEPPTQGKFEVGDLVVNTGSGAASTPMWICSKAGQPGEWAPVGAGNKYAAERSLKVFSTAIREVEIGIEYNDSLDTLLVFINDSYASKDVDYLLEGNKIKVVGNEAWNEMLTNDFTFEFVVFKNIAEAEEIPMISSDQIENGSITLDKLESTLANILTNIKPVDLSGYQLKNDNSLSTNNKTIVGAINELFQEVDSGKQLIADTIDDETITKDSTFAAMSNTVNQIREAGIITDTTDYKGIIDTETARLSMLMVENGYKLTNNESLAELISLLSSKGINYGDIKKVVCGDYFTFVLNRDGTVLACGNNEYGQLGLGDKSNRANFVQVNIDNVKDVMCATRHTYIIKNDNTVWATGYNWYGGLGLGTSGAEAHISTFAQVTENISDIKKIVCEGLSSFMLKNDGTLWSCGYNYYGQLGTGDTDQRVVFTQVATDVKDVSCGEYHTIILKNDNSVWGVGKGSEGQLGLGSNSSDKTIFQQICVMDNVKKIDCGYTFTSILTTDGTLWNAGENYNGQLGLGDQSNKKTFTQVTRNVNNDIEDVICGDYHSCIIKADGTVWITGSNLYDGGNTYGSLGIGSTAASVVEFTKITSANISEVRSIACGYEHTIILNKDDSLFSCGGNGYGQLGIGSTTGKKEFTKITL